MNVNSRLRELYPDSEELFDILLMNDDPAQEVRLKNSIKHYRMLHPKPNIDCLVQQQWLARCSNRHNQEQH